MILEQVGRSVGFSFPADVQRTTGLEAGQELTLSVRDGELTLTKQDRFAYAGPGDVDLLELAAAYAYGLAKKHASHDGTKRAARATAITFLAENNIEIDTQPQEAIETVIYPATPAMSEEAFAASLRTVAAAPTPPAPP